MKKIFLIIILITPLFLRIINPSEDSLLTKVEDYGFSKKEKDINWEYIKDKLFEGKINRVNKTPKKFLGPILFTVNNATKKDSLAINSVIKKLKEVTPNKTVDFFSNFTKSKYSVFTNNLTFKKKQNPRLFV